MDTMRRDLCLGTGLAILILGGLITNCQMSRAIPEGTALPSLHMTISTTVKWHCHLRKERNF